MAAKKKPRGWVTPAIGSWPDERVPVDDPLYGVRRVHRLVITDSEGDAWDMTNPRAPVKLPRPPEE